MYVIKRKKDGMYLTQSHRRYTKDINNAMLVHSIPDGLSQHETEVEIEIREKQTKPTPDLLSELGNQIVAINKANGWNVTTPDDWRSDYKIPAVLCQIHSEISEALEAFRRRDQSNFKEEIADVFIRLLDLMEGIGWADGLLMEIQTKLEKNKKRGYKYGGKRI